MLFRLLFEQRCEVLRPVTKEVWKAVVVNLPPGSERSQALPFSALGASVMLCVVLPGFDFQCACPLSAAVQTSFDNEVDE